MKWAKRHLVLSWLIISFIVFLVIGFIVGDPFRVGQSYGDILAVALVVVIVRHFMKRKKAIGKT